MLVVEDEPSVYLYRLRSGAHEQTGIAGCYSLDEYDRGIIKKHERTRRDKEDDRTRHMLALGAQTGPVFMVYRGLAAIDAIAARVTTGEPLFDFDAADGVRHTLWRVGGHATRCPGVGLCAGPVALYRRRAPSGGQRGARAAGAFATARLRALLSGTTPTGTTMLGVAFPHDQAQILPVQPDREGSRAADAGSLHDAARRAIRRRARAGLACGVAARSRCISIGRGTRCGRASGRTAPIPFDRST